jgi:hypothetical protein
MIFARTPPAMLALAGGLDLGLPPATRFTLIVARRRHTRRVCLRLDVFAIAPLGLPNQSASCLPYCAKDEPDIAGPISPSASREPRCFALVTRRPRRLIGRLS